MALYGPAQTVRLFSSNVKVVATSLRDIALNTSKVSEVSLSKSQDLLCKNMMCGKFGGSCACRLAVVLEKLPNVKCMDLSDNQLKVIPDTLWDLRSLTKLDLSGNGLTELSSRIGQLSNLEVLSLEGNHIDELPQELSQLNHLRELRLGGNPCSGADVLKNLESGTLVVRRELQ